MIKDKELLKTLYGLITELLQTEMVYYLVPQVKEWQCLRYSIHSI